MDSVTALLSSLLAVIVFLTCKTGLDSKSSLTAAKCSSECLQELSADSLTSGLWARDERNATLALGDLIFSSL